MKKFKLLDLLGFVDDEIIERAIETDSASKLKELKRLNRQQKHSRIFKIIWLQGSIVLLVIGAIFFSNAGNGIFKDKPIIPSPDNPIDNIKKNPKTEVNGVDELSAYLKLDLSLFDMKSIANVYKHDDSISGEIKYADGEEIRIFLQTKDNSDIYESKLKEEKVIKNINIKIFESGDSLYAKWVKDGYIYVYFSKSLENINKILDKVI